MLDAYKIKKMAGSFVFQIIVLVVRRPVCPCVVVCATGRYFRVLAVLYV
jgi:hypothetical protein